MKKIWLIVCVSIFFLLMVAYAIMQSQIGQNLVRNALIRAVKEAGLQVHINQIEGTLPHQINLKGVTIVGDGVDVTIKELRMRPVLWRLLKQEVAFYNLNAKEISISQNEPFNFSDGKFRVNRRRVFVRGEVGDWSLFLRYYLHTKEAEFSISNEQIIARGGAEFFPKFSSNILIKSNPIVASIDIKKEGEEYLGKAVWKLSQLEWIGPLDGTFTAIYKDGTIHGTISQETSSIANFNLKIGPGLLLEGTSDLSIQNIQSLHIPDTYGKIDTKATWEVVNQTQELHLDTTLSNFYYQDLFAQTITLYADLSDPFGYLKGFVDFDAKNLSWNYIELESASFETEIGEKKSPYKLSAIGSVRHPFEIYSDGSWQDQYMIQVDHLNGSFLDSSFVLNNPIEITNTENVFKVPNATITVGEGSMTIDIVRENDQTTAELHLTQIPIDFLSLNPLEVAVGGTITLDANIKEVHNKLNGTFTASLNQTIPIDGTAHFKGSFSKNILELKGSALVQENPLLDFNLMLPIHLSIWPFEAEFLEHESAKGTLSFSGQVEDILDYFDLGPHRLEGQLQGSLSFTNTLNRPLVVGGFKFENGRYENYYSGTTLTELQAEIVAEENTIYLRSLTAQDQPGTGTIQMRGEVDLLQSNLYPFRADAMIANLQFAEIDLVKASASGKVNIEGNLLSAVAKGDIDVHQVVLTIPDHIPRPVPSLEVTYRNPIQPVPQIKTKYQPYPLYLDLNILAPAEIAIEGRGLSSKWKGDFHLGGTYSSLATQGTLQLVEGEFNFSARSFKLIEGSLTFSGREHQMPYLNLAGQMETKGITITARLKGPLDDPQITLLSNPSLPLGSIMSYLLFGQDISEIGGFQALELATSLASLAGTGPNVMETTRKSLGVDRLRVVTEPTAEGGETVALQVGKYISKGVLVSFTQGAEESSTNISVEVELKNNFIFQIESDQRQEQGRFTLKWNLNY